MNKEVILEEKIWKRFISEIKQDSANQDWGFIQLVIDQIKLQLEKQKVEHK